jgi:hypothetical protein
VAYGRIQRGLMGGDRFTQIANELFRDPRISFKAKGVFGLISTHRDSYGISVAAICSMGKDKEAAVKAALRELEEYGYLTRRQEQDPKTKKFGAMIYRITDQPEEENPRSEPVVDISTPASTSGFSYVTEPSVDFPPADSPPAENSGGKNTNPEGVVLRASPGGTSPEEHSLSGSASEHALPGDERDHGGRRPSIEEISGAGAAVARQGMAGHLAGCSCPGCLKRRASGSGVPQQPTSRTPGDGWLDDLIRSANQK